MKKGNLKYLLILHLMLMIYSLSGIASKMAAKESFLSFRFCLYYACIIALLGIYAISWQQIIKHLPLTTAFSNKAVTILWGLIWGAVVFHEAITAGKVIGVVMVIAGVVLFARADSQPSPNEQTSKDESSGNPSDQREEPEGGDGA